MNLLDVYKRLYDYFGPQHWWPIHKAKSYKLKANSCFEICVGAILTQNTAWKNVEKAIDNLHAAEAVNPEAVLKIKIDKLAALIRPAGYYNQKAKKLKIFARWFLESGTAKRKLSELRPELLSLWGVGPETADSILLYAYLRPVFVIDAYTKKMLACFGREMKEYEEYRKFFESNLPKSAKLYNEYHALIVAWGKMRGNKEKSAEALRLIGAH